MTGKWVIIISIVLIFSCAICFGAEKKGFLISTAEEKPVATYDTVKHAVHATPIAAATEEESAFIEVYAHEKEIERLKKLVEKRNREVEVLQEKLDNALEKNKTLEVQLYSSTSDEGVHYEVRKGDSLWKIAKRRETYSDPQLWIKIYNANMDRIKDPNLIYPGQLLRVPK